MIFIDINQIFFSIIGVGPTMMFSHLPPEIASHIFSFLSWQEKLWVCDVIPAWKPYLQSTHAWTWTDFNVASWRRNSNAFNQFCKCLQDYGIFMQACQAEGVHVEDLQLFHMYCRNLKSLEINLYQHRYVNSNDVRDLVLSLSAIVRETNLTTLALCGVTYDNDPVSGAEGLLVALQEANLHTQLHKLEFLLSDDFTGILQSLQLFDRLVVLKSHIELLPTATIDALAKKSLQSLHLLSDRSTEKIGFMEEKHINWTFLSSAHPDLQVHYIVKERSLDPSNLCPNPLVQGFVIHTESVSLEVILAIADLYGKTLQSFVHITEYTDANSQTFETFVDRCPHLRTFACDESTRVTEVMLRMHGSRFRELLVCENRIEFSQASDESFDFPTSLASLEEAVSAAMGRPWNAVKPEKFLYKLKDFKTEFFPVHVFWCPTPYFLWRWNSVDQVDTGPVTQCCGYI